MTKDYKRLTELKAEWLERNMGDIEGMSYVQLESWAENLACMLTMYIPDYAVDDGTGHEEYVKYPNTIPFINLVEKKLNKVLGLMKKQYIKLYTAPRGETK